MKKEIKITLEQSINNDGRYDLHTELDTQGDVSPMELLGLLRYFEKQVWMKITTASQVQTKFENNKTD